MAGRFWGRIEIDQALGRYRDLLSRVSQREAGKGDAHRASKVGVRPLQQRRATVKVRPHA